MSRPDVATVATADNHVTKMLPDRTYPYGAQLWMDPGAPEVRAHILGASHVLAVHDLHASRVSSDLPIVTAHVVVEDGCFHAGHITPLLAELQTCLADHFEV